MKLTRYKLMLLLPVPATLLLGYYLSVSLSSYMSGALLSDEGKEILRVPDFELKEVDFEPEVVRVLSYIDLRKRIKRVEERVQKEAEKPPPYKLRFTFVGARKRYAIVNDLLVREGDILPSRERVVKITRERVLLEGKWGKRWLRISD